MLKNCLFLLLISVLSVNAQQYEKWQIFSSANNILDVALSGDGIWAAADGSAFMYNPNDNEFKILSKVEGLNSQLVTSTAVDNNGNIWFGSSDGYVMIYNPIKSIVHNILDIYKSDKSKKRINNILIKGDTAFVATDFGLSLINTNNYSFYDSFLKFGDFSSEASVINVYKTDRIFICTNEGIAVQRYGSQNLSAPESWITYRYSSGIQTNSAKKILLYNGNIITVTNNGIFTFTNSVWLPYILQGSLLNDAIVNNNKLIITANNAILEFSGEQTVEVFRNNSLTFRKTILHNQIPYIATNEGLVTFTSSDFKILKPSSPQTNSFVNLSVDRKSNLWIATGKDAFGIGFIRYDGNNWDLFNTNNLPGIPSNAYYNVYAANDNTIYLSNWGRGLTIYKDGNIKVYNSSNSPLVGIPNDLNFVVISDTKTDSKGNIWLANHQSAVRNQLSVITKGQNNSDLWHHFSHTNPILTENDVLDKMVIDNNDVKWYVVMMGNIGLYYYNDKGTFENRSDDIQGKVSGLPSNTISSLAIDKRGQLWIGTSNGLALISNTSRPD